MNLRDIRTRVVLERRMTETDKQEAMEGRIGAQLKWMIEEISEFYDAVERFVNRQCGIEDVAEETLGLFHMGQIFPAVEFVLMEHMAELYAALQTFKYKEQFYLFREKKLMKGQGQHLTQLGLLDYIKETLSKWHLQRRIYADTPFQRNHF